jgi:flavin-binding protein dodecin
MNATYKLVTVVGTSPQSYEEAIKHAVTDATATLRHVTWFEVKEMRGRVDDGAVVEYQVKLELGFRVEKS